MAYELRISDWSADVCSSDLVFGSAPGWPRAFVVLLRDCCGDRSVSSPLLGEEEVFGMTKKLESTAKKVSNGARILDAALCAAFFIASFSVEFYSGWWWRSEEHTSERQSLMRSSYAVFCLKKNKNMTICHPRLYQSI